MRKFIKLQRMHNLNSPPLYNPVWRGDCSHSFTDGYVPVCWRRIFNSI